MDDFAKEIKVQTLDEIQLHLDRLVDILESLDASGSGQEMTDELLRIFHSVKGNAKSAEFENVAEVSHRFEDLLVQIQRGEKELEQHLLSLLFQYHSSVSDAIDHTRKDLAFEPAFNDLYKTFRNVTEQKHAPKDKLRALVIEDEEEIRSILIDFLEGDLIASAREASNGKEGLELCERDAFDFILTDHKMPEMSGGEFIKQIRHSSGPNASTPVIMITGVQPMLEADQKTWKNVFFLEKPYDTRSLRFTIRCCLKLAKKAA